MTFSLQFWIFSLSSGSEKNSITWSLLLLSFCRAGTGHASTHNFGIPVFRATPLTIISCIWWWHERHGLINHNLRISTLSFRTQFRFPTFRCAPISDVASVEVAWLELLPDNPGDRHKSHRKSAGGSGCLPRRHHPNRALLPNFHHTNVTATESAKKNGWTSFHLK